jgi:hypothetical protein
MDDSSETGRVPGPEQPETVEAGLSLCNSCPSPDEIRLEQKH